MIISVKYTKNIDGSIKAHLYVEDREDFPTDIIFDDDNYVSRPSNLNTLEGRDCSGCIIIADLSNIESIVENEIECLRTLLNNWRKPSLPQDITFTI